ncbi:hypothetical protein FRC12_000537 [Ceratobasidium sp. 428]|nr:hypothetical protein FRC12_000537 [Ceratobasidium sp. 428]
MLSQAESLGLKSDEANGYIKDAAFALLGAMVLFPDIQQRAQVEIDAVVGTDRLPTMNDRPQLGYINRLIEEVLRWRPTAPIGTPGLSWAPRIVQVRRTDLGP